MKGYGLVSRPGKKDGLYWPAQSNEDESPLGELSSPPLPRQRVIRSGQERAPYPNASGGVSDS